MFILLFTGPESELPKVISRKKMKLSACYVTSKYPHCGIFMLGDANEMKLEQINRALGLKQLVKKPSTKGDAMLDLISSNLHEFCRESVPGAPLGGSYHFTLELIPSPQNSD